MLRCVPVTIRAPSMLLPAPHPSASSSALVSLLTQSHHSKHSQAGTFHGRGLLCAARDVVAQEGAALLSCPVDPQMQNPAPALALPSSQGGFVRRCQTARHGNVPTLTLNFTRCKLNVLTVFSNFSISVVHKGRGV